MGLTFRVGDGVTRESATTTERDAWITPLCRPSALDSQGAAHGRFARAIKQRNLFGAELALREMRDPSLLVLIDYLELLSDVRPDRFEALDPSRYVTSLWMPEADREINGGLRR
jgi:hypothetical protein